MVHVNKFGTFDWTFLKFQQQDSFKQMYFGFKIAYFPKQQESGMLDLLIAFPGHLLTVM